MYLAKVYVTYKESILDPKGEAVHDALHRLGYTNVDSVELGKYFEIKLTAGKQPVEAEVEEMRCVTVC